MLVKAFGATILASLLVVLAYVVFWVATVNYADRQIKDALGQVLNADISYTRAVWQPDVKSVAMRLIAPEITFHNGPVQKLSAPDMVVETGFLIRGHWQLHLPDHANIVMRNGRTLSLASHDGEVVWISNENRLSLRAQSLQIGTSAGQPMLQVNDVMLEKKPEDKGIRINLASRPKWGGEEGQLSGQAVLPQEAFAGVVDLVGTNNVPTLGDILASVAFNLQSKGGELVLDNVSFKTKDLGAGLSGTLTVDPRGRLHGHLVVTADKADMLKVWVQRAGLLASRKAEVLYNWARIEQSLKSDSPVLSFEDQRDNLLVSGYMLGTLPSARQVVGNLWAR